MTFNLFDTVRLKEDIVSDDGVHVPAGTLGSIVEVLNQGEAYLLECFGGWVKYDAEGNFEPANRADPEAFFETLGVETVYPHQLQLVKSAEESVRVRTKSEVTIAGKYVIDYRPKGGKTYTHQDISRYLRKFKLCDALRLIGEISYKLFEQPMSILVHKDVPIFDGALAYIAMHLIESSNDYRGSSMTENDLLTAIDMYFGLPDPALAVDDNPLGCLIRFGASQFDYNRDMRHLLPRTLILYRELWENVEDAKDIDILKAIQDIFSLTLEEVLVLSFAFTHQAKKGFFRLYENIENCPGTLRPYFELAKQQSFVDWISSSYTEFRNQSRVNNPISDDYEKFRFNPLWLKPVIIPDRNPKPPLPKPYLVPLPLLISRRVTSGLYFALSDHFKALTGNKFVFPNSFGYVFQEYIGLLFKKAVGEENVIRAWKYGPSNLEKETPDWLIILDNRAVIVEVKTSVLYAEAKKWGDVQVIQKDLKGTIGEGVRQLHSFEIDIDNQICTMPKGFHDIEITEKMIVTYDSLYYLNSFIRDEIRTLNPKIPDTYHWHCITVEELEYFLGFVGTNLLEALEEKRSDKEKDGMDFREYLFAKASSNPHNPYLESVFESFFDDLGIERISDEKPSNRDTY